MVRLLKIIVFIFMGFSFLGTAAAAPPSKEDKEEEVNEYLPVPPISVAMYNKRKRPSGTMTVQLQLKIDDNDQRKVAERVMPRLKNAYMQETTKLSLSYFDINKPININLLSRALQIATNQVLKHEHAKVLIGDVAVFKRRGR